MTGPPWCPPALPVNWLHFYLACSASHGACPCTHGPCRSRRLTLPHHRGVRGTMWVPQGLVTVTGSQGAGDPGQANEKTPWTFAGITWKEMLLPQSSGVSSPHSPAATLHHWVKISCLDAHQEESPPRALRKRTNVPMTSSGPQMSLVMVLQLWRLRTPRNLRGCKQVSVIVAKCPGSVSMEKSHPFRPRYCHLPITSYIPHSLLGVHP